MSGTLITTSTIQKGFQPDMVLEEVAAVFAVSDSSMVAVIGQELPEVEEV